VDLAQIADKGRTNPSIGHSPEAELKNSSLAKEPNNPVLDFCYPWPRSFWLRTLRLPRDKAKHASTQISQWNQHIFNEFSLNVLFQILSRESPAEKWENPSHCWTGFNLKSLFR
jgi:hypothetical protein